MAENPSKNYQASIMGKKVPQIGGNSPNVPGGRSGETGGNTNNAPAPTKNNNMGGNFMPGMKQGL